MDAGVYLAYLGGGGSDKTSEAKRNPSTGISEWFWQERKIVLQLDR